MPIQAIAYLTHSLFMCLLLPYIEKPPLTGLAALEGKTVTDIFPEFKPGKVLRFSRLFGPKKYVSAQWKGLKKKKRKRKLLGLEPAPKSVGFDLRYGPEPKPQDCETHQSVSLPPALLFLS